MSESTRNEEIRDAYAVNERKNRQIVKKSVTIYNQNSDQTVLIRVGRVFQIIDDFRPPIRYKISH